MLGSDWNDRGPLVALALFAIFLLTVAVTRQLEYPSPSRVTQEYEASEYARRAEQRASDECAVVAGAQRVKCINEIEAAEREHHRGERDLNAQRYMALWAALMFFSGLASVAVTAVGVVYVKRTLDQGEKTSVAAVQAAEANLRATEAAIEANQIMRNERRPWMLFDGIEAEYLPQAVINGGATEEAIRLRIEFKNFGASPAIDVNMSYTLVPVGPFKPIRGMRDTGRREVVAPGGSMIQTDFLTEGSIADFWHGDLEIVAQVELRYLSTDRAVPGFISYRIQVSYMDHEEQREDGRCKIHVLADAQVNDLK
jgi:hypothetical protein